MSKTLHRAPLIAGLASVLLAMPLFAQETGETAETADVSGADAAAKAAILASLAFGTWVGLDDVYGHQVVKGFSLAIRNPVLPGTDAVP